MLTAPVFIINIADVRCRIKKDISIAIDDNSPQDEVKLIIRDTSIST